MLSKKMQSLFLVCLTFVSALGFSACDRDSHVPENADTYAQGECQYEDAETNHDGQPKEPKAPEAQPEDRPMQVEVHVSGAGSLEGLKPQCELEGASGNFTGLLKGTSNIDEDGFYFAGFVFGEGAFSTPSGSCEIPDLSVESVGEVIVKAKLSNTSRNCKSYCESKARAYAEQECGASVAAASCRGQAEAQYEASCKTKCSGTTTRRIVAETRLGVAALAELNARQLGVSGLGTIDANLTFDRIEEHDGQVVDEQ